MYSINPPVKKGLLLLAALAAACAQPKTKVEYSGSMDLARYHRIAGLPFTDKKGRGHLIAKAIAKGLPERGFTAADIGQVEKVFARIRPDAEMGLGITELTEIKDATQAQAILSGGVAADGSHADVIMLDTEMGDEVFKAALWPVKGKVFETPAEISEQALGLFAELPSRQK